MKKVASLVGAAALLLTMAGPALGICFGPFCGGSDGGDLEISNRARVSNRILTVSNTGLNEIEGKYVCSGKIRTDRADAYSTVYNDVNYNVVGCEGCDYDDVTLRNKASVRNGVLTVANTGLNEISGKMVGGGRIYTGAAYSNGYVDNIVNTNIVGVE